MTNQGDPELISVLRDIRRDAVDVNQNLLNIQTTGKENRRILNRLQILMIAKLLTLLLLVVATFISLSTLHTVQDANKAIRDCTTPSGECAKRSAAQFSLQTLATSYQSEAQRLTTSIQAAQAIGNDATTVPVYKKRLDEVGGVLRQINENLEDVNHSRQPRNVIPTELPAAPPIP